MTDPSRRPPSTDADRRRRRRRTGALRWPFWLALALLAGATGWLLWTLGQDSGTGGEPLEVTAPPTEEEPPVGDRAVILVFPEWDAAGYVTERRRVPSRGRDAEDLRAILAELCAGPARSGAASALPPRTEVLGAFLDREGREAVLDFSDALVVDHPGGSAAESATLTSILRTVALNFPELEVCRILVGGQQIETIAGHIALNRPFDLRRWL
jgi:spore germination protein GerM